MNQLVSSVQFRAVRRSWVDQCRSLSQLISVHSFVSVSFTDPPGPPFITAVPGVLSLKLAWNSSVEENNVRVLDYKIKVIDGTTLEQLQEYTRITRTSLVVENLKRNWTYVVVIQARNEIGYGESVNISATTLLSGISYNKLFSSWVR